MSGYIYRYPVLAALEEASFAVWDGETVNSCLAIVVNKSVSAVAIFTIFHHLILLCLY